MFEIISPDMCIVCKKEGTCLCVECSKNQLVYKKASCAFCNTINEDFRTCKTCYTKTKVSKAFISFRYEGIIKDLIWAMKYDNKRSYAKELARYLKPEKGLVCFVPSDGKTRRRRGYDQAELLAKHYSKIHKLKFKKVLIRKKHISQVGKSRKERMQNTLGNFIVAKDIKGADLILIDDVLTTGSTAKECAKVLKEAGAKSICVNVLAKG